MELQRPDNTRQSKYYWTKVEEHSFHLALMLFEAQEKPITDPKEKFKKGFYIDISDVVVSKTKDQCKKKFFNLIKRQNISIHDYLLNLFPKSSQDFLDHYLTVKMKDFRAHLEHQKREMSKIEEQMYNFETYLKFMRKEVMNNSTIQNNNSIDKYINQQPTKADEYEEPFFSEKFQDQQRFDL